MTEPRRILRAAWALALAGGLSAVLSGCASDPLADPFAFDRPETGIDYTPVVSGAPSEEIAALMEESLLIFRRQDQGAQSVAFLRRRAEGDIPTAQKILRSYGYYGASVEARVSEVAPPAGQGGNTSPAAEGGEPAPAAAIAEIAIDAGTPFTLVRHDVILSDTGAGPAPELGPAASFGSPVGGPAEAAAILEAERAMVARLRGTGRPYAAGRGREAVADREAATLEVDSRISAGPHHVFGPISFTGAPDVDEEYLRTYLPWAEGDVVDTALLAAFQRRLMGTRLFRAGTVTLPDAPPPGEAAQVTVALEQAPFRTVRAGVRYNTDEGPGVRAGIEHRNLFGANEQVEVLADASLDVQRLTTTFRKPQYLRPLQDLIAGIELRRVEEDAYDELGGTVTAGLERRLGEHWTVGAGGLAEYSSITDQGVTDDALLGGIPLFAAYDGSDDLLDPKTGERLRVDLTPFGGIFANDPVTFLTIDARASAYRRLTAEGDVVAAVRGRVGSIIADALSDVPQTRRLYSGGGGSVRGYAEDFVGPLDAAGDPVGGRSVLEAGGELRGRVWGDLWLAAFVEAGSVSTGTIPSLEEGVQVGTGGGIRYASPVGPIRLDVGVPLNKRDADDSFQVYISIGQAF
ncbi:BamA/TamA family outer membrane protein [Limibaculum sp. FT325]|uniref:autotransporter assembly complex protein TamA n=1 Tax=Thermohalobaculum sediminis TaxID=2939436 RepID=UPI0020C0851E|nr:BamA/TamA family outer membrane protein [Limibaculum sediminis]MCL5777380.1 BamA/TamA family outer membrane protein [Limibaculum sediminis]